MTKREKIIRAIELYENRDDRVARLVNLETVVAAILAAQDDPSEPEIKPGELVRGWWKGNAFIGTLLRGNDADGWWIDTGGGREFWVQRVERFFMPFDWERWPDVNRLIDFDDTSRLAERGPETFWQVGEEAPDGARVIRILKRPEGK